MIPLTKDKRMLGYEVLAPYPDISCFVTTRHGGAAPAAMLLSTALLTPETMQDCVRKNRELLCTALPVRPQDITFPFRPTDRPFLIDDTY